MSFLRVFQWQCALLRWQNKYDVIFANIHDCTGTVEVHDIIPKLTDYLIMYNNFVKSQLSGLLLPTLIAVRGRTKVPRGGSRLSAGARGFEET